MPKQRVMILVVEDDTDLRRMYKIALAASGYMVTEAGHGFEALLQLDSNPPDLVVLDLGLPGIGGLTVQQEIAANVHTRHIPIVIVTGSSMDLDHVGVPCVLRKPVSPDRLLDAVRQCLHPGAPGVGS